MDENDFLSSHPEAVAQFSAQPSWYMKTLQLVLKFHVKNYDLLWNGL